MPCSNLNWGGTGKLQALDFSKEKEIQQIKIKKTEMNKMAIKMFYTYIIRHLIIIMLLFPLVLSWLIKTEKNLNISYFKCVLLLKYITVIRLV